MIVVTPRVTLAEDEIEERFIRAPGPGGQPYGIFGAHTRRFRRFSRHDVEFVQAIANVIASAIVRERGGIDGAMKLARDYAEKAKGHLAIFRPSTTTGLRKTSATRFGNAMSAFIKYENAHTISIFLPIRFPEKITLLLLAQAIPVSSR